MGHPAAQAILIGELLFASVSAAWCALACHYAGPPEVSSIRRRRFATGACILAPVACSLASGAAAAAFAAAVMLALMFAWTRHLVPGEVGPWDLEYARLPDARPDTRAGASVIRVSNVRDFRYRSRADMTAAYYDADYDATDVTSLDLVCSYWSGRAIAHVFLSFGFGDGRRLAVSVETRRRRGQFYSSVAGFFRHYPLVFILADERDLIGVRTDIRREAVYLYRLRTSAEERQRLFRGVMARVAALAGRPEFYDTLLNNCTTNLVSIIDGGLPRSQRLGRSWRLVLSGYADSFAYRIGRLQPCAGFAELKQRSLIVRPEDGEIGADYPARIRDNMVIPVEAG